MVEILSVAMVVAPILVELMRRVIVAFNVPYQQPVYIPPAQQTPAHVPLHPKVPFTLSYLTKLKAQPFAPIP
jgi:hypothetical protein